MKNKKKLVIACIGFVSAVVLFFFGFDVSPEIKGVATDLICQVVEC